jgi:cell division topological specificity factor
VQLLNWFFRAPNNDSSRLKAKDRMRDMLVHDRLELPAGRLETLEEELLAVVSRYFELDKETTRFDLQQYERRAALIANFRLLRSKC